MHFPFSRRGCHLGHVYRSNSVFVILFCVLAIIHAPSVGLTTSFMFASEWGIRLNSERTEALAQRELRDWKCSTMSTKGSSF